MSKRIQTLEGEGPWDPVEEWHIALVRQAGGSNQDVSSLRFAAPGTPRRLLAFFLRDWQRHGERVAKVMAEEIESLPRIVWERTVLLRLVQKSLPSALVGEIHPRSWKCFVAAVVILRPDLAKRIRRGGQGPVWTDALKRAGWDPRKRGARVGAQEMFKFEAAP